MRQRARGFVSVPEAARILRVDRRVLERLLDAGEIEGERGAGEGATAWLKRKSLAVYFWSRPRCAKRECNRRVIGDGPGCNLHRRDGRRNSEETKRRRVETRRHTMAEAGRGPWLRVVRWHPCEWCGKWTERDRFHSNECTRAWLRDQPGADDRLQEGHSEYRARVERVKAERGLLDVEELVDAPARPGHPFRAGRLRRAGVPRTAAAISDHVRDGLLEPERDLGFIKPQLFTEGAVDSYVSRLRNEDQDVRLDGRLTRFTPDTPERAAFRGSWYQARHKSNAEYGRLASAINKAGPKPGVAPDEEALIRQLRERGLSQEQIAIKVGVTRKQVRRVLTAQGD